MNITKQKQTHRYGEQTSCYQWKEDQGKGLRDKNYSVQNNKQQGYIVQYREI